MRIGEAGHRAERDHQRRGHAAERQADADQPGLVVHLQVPELVLQDDRHLLRILRAQSRRYHHAGMVGAERQIEVVLAGQAVGGGIGYRPRHHLAHRRLHPLIVGEQAFRLLLLVLCHAMTSRNAKYR